MELQARAQPADPPNPSYIQPADRITSPGYDQPTGLGSVDASVSVNHWSDATVVPAFQATATAKSLSVTAGSHNTVTLNVAVSGGFSGAVALSVTGLPARVTATFTPTTLLAPGSGNSVLKLTATTGAKAGVYSVTLAATSGSMKRTISLPVSVVR